MKLVWSFGERSIKILKVGYLCRWTHLLGDVISLESEAHQSTQIMSRQGEEKQGNRAERVHTTGRDGGRFKM